MNIDELKNLGVPEFVVEKFKNGEINKLYPSQEKAIQKGILNGKNMLVCTPTSSGKTAIATFAMTKKLSENRGSKSIYLVPLKALANEKFKYYETLLKGSDFKVAISTGEIDSVPKWLVNYDILILTLEKMDSLLRHNVNWLKYVNCVIVDEIHLLNDTDRGPTLEILITILRTLLKDVQIIGLSATIGNPKDLAKWLNAELVVDTWRPVELRQAIYLDGKIDYIDMKK